MSLRGPGSRSWGGRIPVLLAVALAFPGAGAGAQVQDTARADTLVADTTVAPRDTIPPPTLVRWPLRTPSAGATVRVWTREDLLLSGATSVLDLLQQMPGLMPLRSGVLLQPEAASVYGGGGARVVIEWDGYELDPLITPALDLSTIELVHLTEVRVERRLDVLRVRLRSDAPATAEPYSRIEAGIGEPNANLFRGILLTPRFLIGPFGVAVERFEGEGASISQPADNFSAWLRWGLLSEARGIEFTVRSTRLRREPGSPLPLEYDRTDLLLRARNRFATGVVGEAYLGTSGVELAETDPTGQGTPGPSRRESGAQGGGRLAIDLPLIGMDAGVRWRDEPTLPQLTLDGRLRVGGERASVEGGVHRQSWQGGPDLMSWQAQAEVRPFGSLRLFGEYTTGDRGTARRSPDPTVTTPYVTGRTAWRAGLELAWWRLSGGGAIVHIETDSIAPFGLPNEPITPFAGESVTGWEAWGRFALVRDWLYLYGSSTRWMEGVTWAYLPVTRWTGGIELHGLPLESGNLELLARVEARNRGVMLAPVPIAGDPLARLEPRTIVDGYLQLRIIDVRIFVRLDDLASQEVFDLPNLPVNGPRVVYGVKWHFWN